jgi:DNA-binding response OmpR family regulator
MSITIDDPVIIVNSDDNCLYRAINEQYENRKSFHLLNCNNDKDYLQVLDQNKIDLLILDVKSKSQLLNYPAYRVATVFNTGSTAFSNNDILVKKPFYLSSLLKTINHLLCKQNLFISVNESWIYNHALGYLASSEDKIYLTDIENKILFWLIANQESNICRTSLMLHIWPMLNINHINDSIVNRINVHLGRLKSKVKHLGIDIDNKLFK